MLDVQDRLIYPAITTYRSLQTNYIRSTRGGDLCTIHILAQSVLQVSRSVPAPVLTCKQALSSPSHHSKFNASVYYSVTHNFSIPLGTVSNWNHFTLSQLFVHWLLRAGALIGAPPCGVGCTFNSFSICDRSISMSSLTRWCQPFSKSKKTYFPKSFPVGYSPCGPVAGVYT